MLRRQRAIEIVPGSKPLRWRRYDVPQHLAPETSDALRFCAVEGDLDLLDRRHRSTIEAESFVVSTGPPLARLWRMRPTLEDEWDLEPWDDDHDGVDAHYIRESSEPDRSASAIGRRAGPDSHSAGSRTPAREPSAASRRDPPHKRADEDVILAAAGGMCWQKTAASIVWTGGRARRLLSRWPARRDGLSGSWMRPGAKHRSPRSHRTILWRAITRTGHLTWASTLGTPCSSASPT